MPHGLNSLRNHGSNDTRTNPPGIAFPPSRTPSRISEPGQIRTHSPLFGVRRLKVFIQYSPTFSLTYETPPLESVSPSVGIGSFPLLAYSSSLLS